MVTGGPNALSTNCTHPAYATSRCGGDKAMPTGTALSTCITRHAAAPAVPALDTTMTGTRRQSSAAAALRLPLTRPWCPTTASAARTMPQEVHDLLERRPVLPVDRAGADHPGGHRGDVVLVLVVGEPTDA